MSENSRIDRIISDVRYIYECLMSYRDIISLPNCTDCKRKNCEYQPEIGMIIRYNCPHYKG